jgi:hypothetical protein
MLVADPPPVAAAAAVDKPAEVVIVSRDTRSDILASKDTPLPLIKGRRTEDAVLRQTIFLTSTLTGVRLALGAGEEVLRWTYAPYLQRQLCFTSITGQFSCAVAEVEALTEKATGETPQAATPAQTAPVPNPAAEAVRIAVASDLRSRADALFEDDRRLKLTPMLKAAGVSIRRPTPRRAPPAADSRR